jgi:hypothetical protein
MPRDRSASGDALCRHWRRQRLNILEIPQHLLPDCPPTLTPQGLRSSPDSLLRKRLTDKEAAKHQVKLPKRRRFQVPFSSGRKIHLRGTKNREVGSLGTKLPIKRLNLVPLFFQPFLVETSRDLQSFCMIGDGDIAIAKFYCGSGHLGKIDSQGMTQYRRIVYKPSCSSGDNKTEQVPSVTRLRATLARQRAL